MTQLAMLHPTRLLGQEVRETLDRRRELWRSMTFLTTHEEEVANLTEVRGGAAMVQAFEPAALAGVDVVFLCGPMAANRSVVEALPPGATAVILSPDAGSEEGRPLVAEVNLVDAYRGELLLSPHPAAVALAQLLHPLRALKLESAAATVVLPASMHEQEGLDELFDQTRAILAFAEERPQEIFGRQMAFNLAPVPEPASEVGELVQTSLGGSDGPEVSAQLLQAGIFHSLSLSVHLRFPNDPGVESLREVYEDYPIVELAHDEEAPGPIDAAARDEILLGRLARDPHNPGSYWLWAVMDNLTRGGALNAVAILERVLDSPPVT